jgi:hypothetical protein
MTKEDFLATEIVKSTMTYSRKRQNSKANEMLQTVYNMIGEWDQGKIHRWIGYAQCLLVADGSVTLDTLKQEIKDINNLVKEMYDN